MANLSESSVFEEYEKETGINLVQHPLAARVDRCGSVGPITAALQEQAKAFHEFRERDHKIIISLKNAVQVLHKLSGTANLSKSIGSYVNRVYVILGLLCLTLFDSLFHLST